MFGLPWLQDIHSHKSLVDENPVLGHLVTNDLQYDSRSAFTLSLNHRETYTGITDRDRSLTTRRFGELSGELIIKTKINLGRERLERNSDTRPYPCVQRVSRRPKDARGIPNLPFQLRDWRV